MRAQRLHAVAFAGMVADGDVGDAGFMRKVEGLFGDFTGDETVGAGGDGLLEIALRAAGVPPRVRGYQSRA